MIGIIDDATYRVFDGHFHSDFHRYSPGRIIESAVMERAMADARFAGLDWMAGVAAEKILTSNHSEGRMQLVASVEVDRHTDAQARARRTADRCDRAQRARHGASGPPRRVADHG